MTTHIPDDFREKSYDVLVSYQRADDDQREELVEALQARGYEVFWDGKLGPDYWRVEWRNRLLQSKLMIVLWSVTAAQSDEVKDEAGGAKAHEKCLSVVLDGKEHVPKPYLETNRHHWDRNADEATRAAQLEKILGKVAQIVGPPRDSGARIPDTISVDLGTIPGAPNKLIGRDAELAMLRDAWTSRSPKKVNAVVLYALGGAGKSALLRTFANELLAASGGGAARVYGWSAYSQGSGEQKRADADGFISKALADFGWQGELPTDPVERARALAKLVQNQRTLLLLDGLEPLQDPPGLNKGRFKDKGLAELIKLLAGQNPGLVVLTTRQEVPELGGFQSVVINHALDQLSDPAGADLLVELGVRGRQRELEAAVREVQGHALSVTLLGTYLAEVCGGDIRHRDQFDFKNIVLTNAEQSELATDKTIIPAKRAAKVIRGYLQQFEKLATDPKRPAQGLGGPERALLQVLGLFDRPADGPAADALLAQHIPGLTDELFFDQVHKSRWMGFSKWTETRELSSGERVARLREAKGRLRKLHLLARANPNDPHELDAHPVVRAFFAGRLDETAPEAAKAAHDILYRHYAAAAPDLPDTLEEMQPLFHAVQHGVKAGRVEEVWENIFWRRINRRSKQYLTFRIGAYGVALGTMGYFFASPWHLPLTDLSSASSIQLLKMAAGGLVATGRLIDSIAPRQKAISLAEATGNMNQIPSVIADQSATLLVLGRLMEAQAAAEHGLKVAGGNPIHLPPRAADLGAVQLARGDLVGAKESFKAVQSSAETTVYGWRGYAIGDYYTETKDVQLALNRANKQIYSLTGPRSARRTSGGHRAGRNKRGKDELNLGFAYLLQARAQASLGVATASDTLDAAIDRLRQSGADMVLPSALLARAGHRRRRAAAGEPGLVDGIRADLAEVEDIAGDEMRLYLADLALERARLALDVPSAFVTPEAARAEAQAQTAKAAQLIVDTAYHRRDGELAELKARLAVA